MEDKFKLRGHTQSVADVIVAKFAIIIDKL